MIKDKAILVVNIGSSSLKLALFSINQGKLRECCREKIVFNDWGGWQKRLEIIIRTFFQKNQLEHIDLIVHRVVYGGKFTLPVKVTAAVVRELEKYSAFAPLHNPYNIIGIKLCRKLFPFAEQYAVFDTAFHKTMAVKAKVYGLPYSFYRKGIMKYGFHGSNFAYCTKIASQFLHKEKSKLIICHLGNGCSITAVKDGKSVDTSMGFSPNEGLVMGTRAGDIDSGVIEFLLRKNSTKKVFEMLRDKSGLLGISGASNDVKELHAISLGKGKRAERAKLALDIFTYRIVKYIGAYYAVLSGCDAIVFTGGIGENAWYLREEICKQLAVFGLKLDMVENKMNKFEISAKNSSVKLFVVAANEEMQMVQEIAGRLL
ncbi:acetate/propionate family kinase [Candidatus Woesearchaeota archaeon]|nr:acetate/propionate family kinase [Candidatus Woesearchaeota archaeon]